MFFQWSWNFKENRLYKDINKETFEKDPMNLIETNRKINVTSDRSASSNNSLKSHLDAKSFNLFLIL